jgi:hypothetical protein
MVSIWSIGKSTRFRYGRLFHRSRGAAGQGRFTGRRAVHRSRYKAGLFGNKPEAVREIRHACRGSRKRHGADTNSTGLGTIAANYSGQWRDENISLLGYHTREQYHSSFSSVSADRNTERITFTQTVPSEAVGAAGLWRHSQTNWNLLAGGDMQRVEGFSTDRLVPPGLRIGGGSQLQHGVFAQLDAAHGPAKFFLGARHQFTGQDSKFFSPSAGVFWAGTRFAGVHRYTGASALPL